VRILVYDGMNAKFGRRMRSEEGGKRNSENIFRVGLGP